MSKIIKTAKPKKNVCAICGRTTYRMQHGIYICSYCELKWRVEFDGRRELVDRSTNTVVQVIDPSKPKDDAVIIKEDENENP